jgi:RNA polymerase sigma-70 factor (ECF subfamily)
MGNDFYQAKILPYAGIIIKICRAYANSQEDFEDYYQEVCLQIWRSRERFRHQCAWTTWLYKISLNVCLTYLKKQKHLMKEELPESLLETLIEDKQEDKEASITALYRAIHQLSELDRAIILLYLERQSNQDIAEIIGITVSNVGVRVARIKSKLNRIINSGE